MVRTVATTRLALNEPQHRTAIAPEHEYEVDAPLDFERADPGRHLDLASVRFVSLGELAELGDKICPRCVLRPAGRGRVPAQVTVSTSYESCFPTRLALASGRLQDWVERVEQTLGKRQRPRQTLSIHLKAKTALAR
ncbi:MAG: hypothetical protein AAFX41_13925 [Bacteroidota bacterium]